MDTLRPNTAMTMMTFMVWTERVIVRMSCLRGKWEILHWHVRESHEKS